CHTRFASSLHPSPPPPSPLFTYTTLFRSNIVDLQPGTYTIAFTLTGFSTFKRDGVTLTSGFTATVDAQMSVGALEESVTVSGASDRKSTRLNSSHVSISYAVFCLKKKTNS